MGSYSNNDHFYFVNLYFQKEDVESINRRSVEVGKAIVLRFLTRKY